MGTRAVCAAAIVAVVAALGGCAPSGSDDDSTPSPTQPPGTPSSGPRPAREASSPARGLVYYVAHRARTGEPLLVAEQTGLRGRDDLLTAVRTALAGRAVDPDYSSPWRGDVVDRVKLWWDGDEGYYAVRLRDEEATRRPPGMTMREAHLAIQQVVWTLDSVGRVPAPVRFSAGRPGEAVTDLLGIPATGPGDTYLAADHSGVLGSVNTLAPADGSTVDGVVDVSGLAESFEATVGVRVVGPGGEVVHEHSTQAEQCCGRMWPWTYSLDTTGWQAGDYTLSAFTDDPVGIAQGSDGPEIDTKTITIR